MFDDDLSLGATVPCPPPAGCSAREPDFAFRMMRSPGPAAGSRRETTSQADDIARGARRFNARGCK